MQVELGYRTVWITADAMRSSPYKLRCILCCCPCCFGGIGRSLQEFSNSGAFWSFTFWYVRRSRRTVRLERADAPRSQDHLRRFWRLLCRARAGWLRQPRRQPHARAVSLSVAAHAGAAAPCPRSVQCCVLGAGNGETLPVSPTHRSEPLLAGLFQPQQLQAIAKTRRGATLSR